jgi:anti-anti-sigma factor
MDRGIGRIRVDQTSPGLWIVEIQGEHDLSTTAGLNDELAAILAQGTTIVIDLSDATFIDSSVLREMIVTQRRVNENEHEHLAVVAPRAGFAARLIAFAGANQVLSVFETRAEALKALAT